MNALASSLLWLSMQVALFSLVGSAAFCVARRRGPQAAATCTAIVLGLTLVLTAMIASPWPRWVSKASAKPVLTIQSDSAPPIVEATTSTVAPAVDPQTPSLLAMWWDTTVEFIRNAQAPPATEASLAPSWQAWLLWLTAAGVSLCCLRLALGIWAVGSLRRGSQRIEDAELMALVTSIAKQVGAGEVEARETALLRSAVTIGWRKPVLLLPMDWPLWTEAERRAVLAHELVHVARSDYATAFLARLTTAIHFYQPLVLWLNRQLRMQQELAADSQAAIVSGNRQTYLTTLAHLALRADDHSHPWAARAFLPNTSSLIKRVAWLKRKGNPMEKTLGSKGRWIVAVLMAAIALALAGIRAPGDASNTALAQQANPNQEKPQAGTLQLQFGTSGESRGFTLNNNGSTLTLTGTVNINTIRDMNYVPADAKLVIAASPIAIAKLPAGEKLLSVFREGGFEKKFGFQITDLADFQIMKRSPQADRFVLRMEKAYDWKKNTLDRAFPDMESKKFGNQTYFLLKDKSAMDKAGDLGPAFYVADDRTLVAGSEEEIKLVIGGEKRMELSAFPAFVQATFAARIDASLAKEIPGKAKLVDGNPALAMLLALVEQVNSVEIYAAASPTGGDAVAVEANVDCQTAMAADNIAKTLDAARVLASNFVAAKETAWREAAAPPVPQEQIVAVADLIKVVKKALTDAKISGTGNKVVLGTNIELGPPVVAAFVMPALEASREAAMRAQSMNNMRQLGLAMYVYEDANKHFPPAAIRGKDGKPLLSWRVAILPYLDQKELYDQFHLDEPWDSEHNKALIRKMPGAFRDPHEDAGSTNASYLMPTGKGTIGGNEEGTKIASITDGTSNTIMIVDAKRDIPWTKPEDIEIDADPAKPMPKFGGYLKGASPIFGAAFADGSVRIIAESIDPAVLRAMFTIAGGEPMPNPDGQAGPRPAKSSSLRLKRGNPAEMYWNDEKITQAELPRKLQAAAADQQSISIAADNDVAFNDLNLVLEAAKTAGAQIIVFNSAPVKLEFRRAESAPAAGLTEVTPPGAASSVYVVNESGISNGDISEATVVSDSNGQPAISIVFTPAGSEKMKKLTEQQMGKPLVIMANGKVLSAPTVRATISDKAQISGNFSQEEAERIAKGIRK